MARYDSFLTHRRSRRLRGYEYDSPGWYFVTICTKGRAPTLGCIRGGIVGLSAVGSLAHRCWQAVPTHFAEVCMGAFIVMPNHVHGLVHLPPRSPVTLGHLVNTFKGAVTRQARRGGHAFAWQPRCHDHVVRDAHDFDRIAAYIQTNPTRWETDRLR